MDYTSQGYDIFLQKEPLTPQSGQRELTELEFGVQNQVISASGITAGLQKSTSGKLQLDWDNGVMTIIFPQGFMKIGSVGKDNNGNDLFGILLNDGNTNRVFLGYQPEGF